MDEVYGVYFGENWISIDPKVDYDKTRDAVQRPWMGTLAWCGTCRRISRRESARF